MVDIVVGSGPSGVAAAAALLERGREVLLLDGGKVPDPAAVARRATLGARPFESWDPAQRAAYVAPQHAASEGQVLRFGSDFAMEPVGETFAESGGVALRASLATGGLSNVWGSAALPYAARDIAGWPVTDADLQPHYCAVAELMDISGARDDLAELFPGGLPPTARQVPPTPQAGSLLDRLRRREDRLAALGVRAGAARQAVSADCVGCGLCLHGCPYGFIWSAAATLETFRSNPGFRHRPGMTVRAIAEQGDDVVVSCDDGTVLNGDRIYLAAGVLGSARILLSSVPQLGALTLQDSQHAFLPMLHRWAPPRRVDAPPLTTLPQLFVEIDAAEVSPHLVHAQLYSWNDFFAREMVATYGRRLPGSGPLWEALARRLIVAQIFLHSDHSARIDLRLAADGRLNATARNAPATGDVLTSAARRLARAMGLAGVHALTFARRDGPPGSSFHVGGCLPMSNAPGAGKTDTLGRPAGWRRVHVVDASVLPGIPATTITFATMANAHRIASTPL